MTDGLDEVEERARAGRAVRDVGHALVGRQASPALISEVATTLESLAARLDEGEPRQRERENRADRWIEPVADGQRMVRCQAPSMPSRNMCLSRPVAASTWSEPISAIRIP